MAEVDSALDLQTTEDYRALIRRHDAKLAKMRRQLLRNDALYEGEMPLKYMAPEIAAAFGDRITQLVINIAELGVRSHCDRLSIDGVRLSPTLDADNDESKSWTNLDMDLVSMQVHEEAASLGLAHAQVGEDDDGNPVVTPESPLQMTTVTDSLGRTQSAVKRWVADDDRTRMRTLHLPDRSLVWELATGKWQLIDTIDHGYGVTPVFTFVNRGRILKHNGKPVFQPVVPIYEALNKMATDMMVGGEFHALPRRFAVNIAEDAAEDENGNPVSPLKQLIGAIWNIPGVPGGDKVQVGQFDASDLRNFHDTIKLLLQVAGHLMGLPAAYTAFATDNPAAEGAIKAGEIQLIRGVERMQTEFSPRWRPLWRLKMAIEGRASEARELSMIWRDPATPTVAQKADAVTKLVSTKDSAGRSIVPVEDARELMGFSAQMRDSMAEHDKGASLIGQAAALADTFGQAAGGGN